VDVRANDAIGAYGNASINDGIGADLGGFVNVGLGVDNRSGMDGGQFQVSSLIIDKNIPSPSGTRSLFLARWFSGRGLYGRVRLSSKAVRLE